MQNVLRGCCTNIIKYLNVLFLYIILVLNNVKNYEYMSMSSSLYLRYNPNYLV